MMRGIGRLKRYIWDGSQGAIRRIPSIANMMKELDRSRAELGRFEAWRAEVLSAQPIVAAPEFELSLDNGYTPERAAELLNKSGCLIVRGGERTKRAVRDYSALLDSIGYGEFNCSGGGLWQIQDTADFRRMIGAPVSGHHGQRIRFPLHAMVREVFHPMLHAYYGSDLMMSTVGTSATIRTVNVTEKTGGMVKFHQDISPVNLDRNLTFWVLCEPDGAGRVAPGLQFISSKRSRRTMKENHDFDANGYHGVSSVRMSMDEFLWTPEINVGDVVIFDPYCCHASFSRPEMPAARTSADFRVGPFNAQTANSFIEFGHGLVIFNETSMIEPSRVASTDPLVFAYDYARSTRNNAELEAALYEADTTNWKTGKREPRGKRRVIRDRIG